MDKIKKITFVIAIIVILGIVLSVIFAFRQTMSERPTTSEQRAIRTTIDNFVQAKDIYERMKYVAVKSTAQKKARSYQVKPFTNIKILDKEIELTDWTYDKDGNTLTVVVDQNLSYVTGDFKNTSELKITYKLKKEGKWLITDFEPNTKSNN